MLDYGKKHRAIIITALPLEYQAVRSHLLNSQHSMSLQEEVYEGTVYERGIFLSWEITLVEIGMGNPTAAFATERAIQLFRPKIALFVGIAGGIKDVRVGDVVCASEVYAYEPGKAGKVFQTRSKIQFSSHDLEQRARAEARKRTWLQRLDALPVSPPNVIIAPIASGEKVLASTDAQIYHFLRSQCEDAVAVDMEGYGFLLAVHANRSVSALIIRGISDLIEGKSESDRAGYQPIAAKHASAFAFELLANIVSDNDHSSTYLSNVSASPHFLLQKRGNFVGRENERAEIRRQIAILLQTGGFLTITGPAGQGKSCILAMLIEEMGQEKVGYHFIPYTPGMQHQVELLQNLIAHLIRKYRFPEIDITNTSYPVLRSTFHRLLKAVADRGGQEILFIDGLDQLETEHTGWRDLSFLPLDPSQGIVFVLGTRPNDTLKPLALMKPHIHFSLPVMSYPDFLALLQRQGLCLEDAVAERYYQVLGGHAFYLDLATRILAEQGTMTPDEVIAQVENNPDNLLWLSLERMKQPLEEWRSVIKPILGVLLEAREPLGIGALSEIIGVDEDRLLDGLIRLGGLVMLDERQHSSLFHLKLYEYLRKDPRKPDQISLFSSKEERLWHLALVRWSQQKGLDNIWRDGKNLREQEHYAYVRQHYITHLFGSQEWQSLFNVLDTGHYGRAKIHRDDPSMRAYAFDLDLGRRAVIEAEEIFEKALDQLPRLWRYTLLKCSLASRADRYPVRAFGLLVLLHRQEEALGLAELVTDPNRQAEIFCEMAICARRSGLSLNRRLPLHRRMIEIIEGFKREIRQVVLRKLVKTLVDLQAWQEAERACIAILDKDERSVALSELGQALVQEGEWREAERICITISNIEERERMLEILGQSLWQMGEKSEAQRILQEAERSCFVLVHEGKRTAALRRLGLLFLQAGLWQEAERICMLIPDKDGRSTVLRALAQSLSRRETWQEAERVCAVITANGERVRALSDLGQVLAQFGEQKEARRIWRDAEQTCRTFLEREDQARALSHLGQVLAQFGEQNEAQRIWQEVEQICTTISTRNEQAEILRDLGSLLAQFDEQKEARRIWQEAEQVCVIIPGQEEKAEALRKLGQVLAQAGEQAEAKRLWRRAEQVCLTIPNRTSRVEALRRLGQDLAWAEESAEARRIWQGAEQICITIPDDVERVEALKRLEQTLVLAGETERAEQMCLLIPDENQRVEALRNLAQVLGKQEQAQHVWQRAEQACAGILHEGERAEALRKLGQALTQTSEQERELSVWREAERVCASIPDETSRFEALRKLSQAFAQLGMWERAIKACFLIQKERYQAEALSELGHVSMLKGEPQIAYNIWREIEKVHNGIPDSWRQAEALSELEQAFVQAKEWRAAEQACALFPDENQRAEALAGLALTLAQEEEWQEAERICALISPIKQRSEALMGLALMLAQREEWHGAVRVCALISDDVFHVETLRKLGQTFTHPGNKDNALLMWQEAEQICTRISDLRKKTEMLEKLAYTLTQAGEWQEAERICYTISEKGERARVLNNLGQTLTLQRIWLMATRVYLAIPNEWQRSMALNELSQSLAQCQNWHEAEQVCALIPHKEWRIEALGKVGQALALAGEEERAYPLWKEAEWICLAFPDRKKQAEAFGKLGQLTALAGATELSQRMWQEAEKACTAILYVGERAEAYRKLALALVRAQILQEAERVCNLIVGDRKRSEALYLLGQALIQKGEWSEAERVLTLISDDEKRSQGLNKLVLLLVQRGLWQEAERICAFISSTWHRSESLSRLVQAFTSLGSWQEAERICAFISSTWHKSESLSELVQALAQAGEWKEAERICELIPGIWHRSEGLNKLGQALAQAGLWKEAERICISIAEEEKRTEALGTFAQQLVQAEAWQEIAQICMNIQKIHWPTRTVSLFCTALAEKGKYAFVLQLVQQSWLTVDTREIALQSFAIAKSLFVLQPSTGLACYDAFRWVDQFLDKKASSFLP